MAYRPIFTGYIQNVTAEYEFNTSDNPTATLILGDALREIQQYHRRLGYENIRREDERPRLTGEYVKDILDAVSWSGAKRAIDPGTMIVQPWRLFSTGVLGRFDRAGDVLDALDKFARIEMSYLYVNRDGVVVFEDFNNRALRPDTPVNSDFPLRRLEYEDYLQSVINEIRTFKLLAYSAGVRVTVVDDFQPNVVNFPGTIREIAGRRVLIPDSTSTADGLTVSSTPITYNVVPDGASDDDVFVNWKMDIPVESMSIDLVGFTVSGGVISLSSHTGSVTSTATGRYEITGSRTDESSFTLSYDIRSVPNYSNNGFITLANIDNLKDGTYVAYDARSITLFTPGTFDITAEQYVFDTDNDVPLPVRIDPLSIDKYGLREEDYSLSDTTDYDLAIKRIQSFIAAHAGIPDPIRFLNASLRIADVPDAAVGTPLDLALRAFCDIDISSVVEVEPPNVVSNEKSKYFVEQIEVKFDPEIIDAKYLLSEYEKRLQ